MILRHWLAQKLTRLARWMPARLYGQFGDEIEQVLSEHLQAAAQDGWLPFLRAGLREIAQFPGIHLRERLFRRQDSLSGGVTMSNRLDALLAEQHEPAPWGWALVGLFPFLISWIAWLFVRILSLAGIEVIANETSYMLVFSHALFALVVLLCVALIIAWVRSFPAWSYTTGFLFFVFSLYITQASIPGLTLFGYQFERQLLGARALLPLAALVIISLFLTRKNPARPFLTAVDELSHDMSRFSFGLFGLTPFFLFMIYDEVQGEETFVMLLNLFMAACALVYLRARRTVVGVGAIVGGQLLVVMVSAVYLGMYWEGRQEEWMPAPASGMQNLVGTLACAVPILFFTLGPWLVQRYNARHRKENL